MPVCDEPFRTSAGIVRVDTPLTIPTAIENTATNRMQRAKNPRGSMPAGTLSSSSCAGGSSLLSSAKTIESKGIKDRNSSESHPSTAAHVKYTRSARMPDAKVVNRTFLLSSVLYM